MLTAYLSGWAATITLLIQAPQLDRDDDIACAVVAALWPITIPIMILIAIYRDRL